MSGRKSSLSRIQQASLPSRIVVGAILTLIALTTIVPMWNTLVLSFTSSLESMEVVLKLWPRKPSISSYEFLLGKLNLWRPFLNNTFVTVMGTFLFVVVNTCAGFAMTRPRFPAKLFLGLLLLVPMMFPSEAIFIPKYLVMKTLGLIDSLWAVILDGVGSTVAIFLMRNYFTSIPRSLEESAHIDGAGQFGIFMRIYLPLSTPGIATITLMEMIGKWNHLFSAILYLHSARKYTLQLAISSLIVQSESAMQAGVFITDNVRAASIIVALVPMLALYPFIQRYFIKGIYLGAIKE